MANRNSRFVCTFAMETSTPCRILVSVHGDSSGYAGLFHQQFRFKNDLVCVNTLNFQVVQSIFAVKEAEQLVCRPVVQLFTWIRVNMRHHQIHLVLRKILEWRSLGKDPSDEFMRDFDTAFLVGSLWVTIKDICPAASILVELNRWRVGKFTTPVSIMPNSG